MFTIITNRPVVTLRDGTQIPLGSTGPRVLTEQPDPSAGRGPRR